MATTKSKGRQRRSATSSKRAGIRTLGLGTDDAVRVVQQVQKGFPYSRLAKLQRASGLPWEKIARFVAISKRTLTRRQHEGRLHGDESDRVLRASRIFEMAVELFEGDIEAATQWLQTPQPGLGGEVPLEFASTDVGAREVEDLITRLEHGVFT